MTEVPGEVSALKTVHWHTGLKEASFYVLPSYDHVVQIRYIPFDPFLLKAATCGKVGLGPLLIIFNFGSNFLC
jgi:hypothetical protein